VRVGGHAGVRVAALAGACALLLAVLALAPGSDWAPPGGRAEAAECTWQRHAKRVVKHVKRHGRPRRLVHTRHWWTCNQAKPPGTVVALPAPAAPAPPVAQPDPEANVVGVTADDAVGNFGYTLSRPSTHSGRVRVELNNQGEDPHNLNLERQGGESEPVYQLANTLPGQQHSASFELPPGTYRLWCSLLEHDAEGMHSTLIVE
jgi:plastocyanin